jgi:hypothetical protein
MPRVRFEPTIPAYEQARRVHALDRAAIVIGILNTKLLKCYVCYGVIEKCVFLDYYRNVFSSMPIYKIM